MTSPIPPAAAARCREVVRLLDLRDSLAEFVNDELAAVPQRYKTRLTEIDARLSALHRPAVSVERLRALIAGEIQASERVQHIHEAGFHEVTVLRRLLAAIEAEAAQ